ncbi:MAG: 5-deoxy-glucuronate isomerase [Pirellulales bacterium]|nr:5-deoxy-glucuronate isomerase [Pirellulales bacterium]
MNEVKSGHFIGAETSGFRYVEKASPLSTHLQWLTYGVHELSGPIATAPISHPGEEALLFCWEGRTRVTLCGTKYELGRYDVLYVPRSEAYSLSHGGDHCRLVVCRAPAEKAYPAYYAGWSEILHDERRLRRLKGKDVFLMFDVSEQADKLMAGYTFFQPFQRSWPPHNHTDQEEIYIFLSGHGAMEVYAEEETKHLVRSVGPGDAVTIPVLNYHPVFSQEEPLEFIWCIAGARYWVGDKNKNFMTGSVAQLTT